MKQRTKKDDFRLYDTNNPYIFYSKSKDIFKCKDHPGFNLINKGTTSRHSKTAHQMDLEGNLVPDESQEDDSTTDDYVDRIKSSSREELEKMMSENLDSALELVNRNIHHDIAQGAVKLARNITLQFLYLRTKVWFPAAWDFAEWTCYLLEQGLKKWGISVNTYQDPKVLSEDQLKAATAAREEWKRLSETEDSG